MDKKRRFLRWTRRGACFVLAIALVFGAFAAGNATEDAPQPDEPETRLSASVFRPSLIKKDQGGKSVSRPLTDADTPVCENDRLALYVDESRAVIKLRDKDNDYVWSSGLEETDVEQLTATWQRFAQSLFVAEYVDRYAPTTPVREFPVILDIVKKADGLEFQCELQKLSLKLTVFIQLDEDGITLEIPDDKMIQTDENTRYRLVRISVMPFFGAVKSLEADGYLFIPDGCGALIRFGETQTYSLAYTARVYGKDFGNTRITEIESDFPTFQDLTAHIPVFGIAHGNDDNAFVAVITGGEEYADISANPAGVRIEYFWGCPIFNYLEAYYQPTGTGRGFTYLPDQPNVVNARVSYKLLSGRQAGYVGMANRYKEMLVESGALVKHTVSGSQIPLHLQAYMAEQEKGLIGSHTKALTQLSDVENWIEELENADVGNLLVSLTGFSRGGASGSSVGDFRTESRIGGDGALKRLYERMTADGNKLLLTMNYSSVYEHQAKLSSFVTNIDHTLASVQDISFLFETRNFLSSRSLDRYMKKLKTLPDYKRSVLLEGVGFRLLSDYTKGKARTRSQALEEIVQALETAADSVDCLALESPNAYAFRFADYIVNTPDTHSQYIYESDTVPFLQIVLSGYVDCFSSPLNLGSLTREDLLKLIDFHMYPSYLLTDSLASAFSGTNVLDIYFSDYNSVKDYILEEYPLLNEVLLPVCGRAIVDRTVVEDGVSVVEYEGGIQIVVNYNNTPFRYQEIDVPGQTAVRLGG